MLWRCSVVLSLVLLGHVSGLYVQPEAQSAVGLTEDGLLKSFTVESGDEWAVSDIIDVAQLENADVWRISPSHVDVYYPTLRDYQSSMLNLMNISETTNRITKSSLFLPASSPHAAWNLSSLTNTTFHSMYHPLREVQTFMEDLSHLYPENVQLINIGHSAEQRDMYALKISRDLPYHSAYSHHTKVKKGVVVTGAMHAREWVAMSTALYLAHALVSSSSEPHAMSSLLDNHDFYIIPVPNPDGYLYTWEHDRLWYKNRQIIGPYEKCVGIDLQRNWGHKWKRVSRFPSFLSDDEDELDVLKPPATDPCAPWYPGHRAFEAPEANNIANFVTKLPALELYIDLRSYGQMLSTPFSWSCKKSAKDAENQNEAAHGAVRAIKLVHGTTFTTGTLCEMVYKAPGNVVDWMYSKAGIEYSYSVHLRDTGTYGFSLPAEWIRPVGEETASMIHFLSDFLSKRF